VNTDPHTYPFAEDEIPFGARVVLIGGRCRLARDGEAGNATAAEPSGGRHGRTGYRAGATIRVRPDAGSAA
jgi:hypothetical protein